MSAITTSGRSSNSRVSGVQAANLVDQFFCSGKVALSNQRSSIAQQLHELRLVCHSERPMQKSPVQRVFWMD